VKPKDPVDTEIGKGTYNDLVALREELVVLWNQLPLFGEQNLDFGVDILRLHADNMS
jgi:hypothetical protein